MSHSTYIRRAVSAIVVAAIGMAIGRAVHAQANVPQFRGYYGLGSGTLAPAGGYVGFFYNSYDAQRVVASDGSVIGQLQPASVQAVLTGTYSFPSPFLGAHWSASVAIPWTDLALATANQDFPTNWGFSDMYVQPVKAGWKYPSADIVTGLGVFMPTGRFENGAADNTGLGMWSYEYTAGTTVYLGPSRQGTAATLFSFQTQSHVRGTDKRAGNVVTLEGGVGHTMLKDVGKVGLVYYAQWKVSDDQNYHLPAGFNTKDRVFGVGPEVTIPFPMKPMRGIVTVRYFMELGNRVAAEGNSLVLVFNLYQHARRH